MNIITKEAEKILSQKLQDYYLQSPYQRVIFIRFSKMRPENEDWQNDLIQTARDFFYNQNIEIYICHDNDVFIINRACTLKLLDQFMDNLANKMSPALLAGLASLFEIGFDLERIHTLCKKKIEALEDNRKELQNYSEIKTTETVNPCDHLDQQLINTLRLRRKDRKSAEILIVEDDLFSQKLINYAIGNQYTLTMTDDGSGAVMNYIKKAPDVLFLDIGLPDIDGHEVLKKIFQIDPDAFVVMFSGKGDRENITRAIQTGAKGFIGKPFTQEKLFQYINKSPFIVEKNLGVRI